MIISRRLNIIANSNFSVWTEDLGCIMYFLWNWTWTRNQFAIRYGHIFTDVVVLKNMILRRTDNCDVQYF